MQTYESPSRGNGIRYTMELPDGWITQQEDDGERSFITHRSPAGSSLRLTVVSSARTDWRPKGMPATLIDPSLQMAYTLTDQDSCLLPSQSMLQTIVRHFMHGLGRHERLDEETLGANRGFTYKIGYLGRPGWYGWFVQAPCMVRVDFQPVGEAPEGEINVARDILSSLRISTSSRV